MEPDQIIEILDILTVADLRRVKAKVDELASRYEAWQQRDWRSEQSAVRRAYRQEYVKCGKERCRRCCEGPGHGPYWYAYWSEGGRTRKQYIGKQLPPGLPEPSGAEH